MGVGIIVVNFYGTAFTRTTRPLVGVTKFYHFQRQSMLLRLSSVGGLIGGSVKVHGHLLLVN